MGRSLKGAHHTMRTRELQYVDRFIDRHGRARYYFRRSRGFKRVVLPGLPGSSEFLAAYAAALDGAAKIEIGADRTLPGTINAAIVAFHRSDAFTKNRAITQATDRNIL